MLVQFMLVFYLSQSNTRFFVCQLERLTHHYEFNIYIYIYKYRDCTTYNDFEYIYIYIYTYVHIYVCNIYSIYTQSI